MRRRWLRTSLSLSPLQLTFSLQIMCFHPWFSCFEFLVHSKLVLVPSKWGFAQRHDFVCPSPSRELLLQVERDLSKLHQQDHRIRNTQPPHNTQHTTTQQQDTICITQTDRLTDSDKLGQTQTDSDRCRHMQQMQTDAESHTQTQHVTPALSFTRNTFHLIVFTRKSIIHRNNLKSNISPVVRVSIQRSMYHDMTSSGISLAPDLPHILMLSSYFARWQLVCRGGLTDKCFYSAVSQSTVMSQKGLQTIRFTHVTVPDVACSWFPEGPLVSHCQGA